MLDMDRVVGRVIDALKAGDRVCIWGDYDVDGVTSTALTSLFFEKIPYPLESIIPNRFTDGYGVSPRILEPLQVTHTPRAAVAVHEYVGADSVSPEPVGRAGCGDHFQPRPQARVENGADRRHGNGVGLAHIAATDNSDSDLCHPQPILQPVAKPVS